MPITIQCPECDSRIRAPDSVEGRPVTCPKCGTQFTATASPDPPPVAAPPAPANLAPVTPVKVKTEPAPPAKPKESLIFLAATPVESSSPLPAKAKTEPAVPARMKDSLLSLAPAKAKAESPTAGAHSEPPLKPENWAEIASAPPEAPAVKEEAPPPPAPRSPNVLVDFLLFRKMIAPVVIQVFFWFGFVGCVLFGGLLFARVLTLLQGGAGFGPVAGYLFGTLAIWFLGPLVVRVACEVLILFFRMNDTLLEIKRATQELPDEDS